MTSSIATADSHCAAASVASESIDGPLVDLAAIEAALFAEVLETAGTRGRSFSIYVPDESSSVGAAAASTTLAAGAVGIIAFINPIPQIKRLKEVFYICCKKESFEVLSDVIERLQAYSIDNWATCREMVMHTLLAHTVALSEGELDKIEKALSSDLKTFSILNIRDLTLKTRLNQSLIDKALFPKKLLFENPRQAQMIALDFTLKSKQWDLFLAFCADASSDLVIPILDTFFETLSLDASLSSKFLLDIKRVGGVLGKRYKLKGFEKHLSDWIELTTSF